MDVTLFTPHSGQETIINGFADSAHKFGIVATGRQFGKSRLAQNLMLYWLLQNPGNKGAWVAPIYNQCKKVFNELTNASHQIITKQNKADLNIEFVNGSTLQFLSTDNYNTIRGFSFNFMVVDEAAYVKEEAINEAVFPTLSAIGKKCLIISTPKAKNWFYTWYLRGSNPNNETISFKGRSADNPHIDLDFISSQASSLPWEIYLQEYEAQFSEATNDVFRNLENVCIRDGWEEPRGNANYYFGVDVGLANDFTVCSIIEESGRTAKILRFNGTTFEDAGKTICTELRKYNVRGGYCESNGIGRAILELIQSERIKVTGFTTTNESKTRGIRKLIADIESGMIELPSKKLMPECYNELSAFTYKINNTGTISFTHPSGFHDDIVDAIWLANLARNEIAFKKSGIYIGGPKMNEASKVAWGSNIR
jgi:hypothetical protein